MGLFRSLLMSQPKNAVKGTRLLEYIESTGEQAFITDFILSSDTGTTELKVNPTDGISDTQGIYGFISPVKAQRISIGIYRREYFVSQGFTNFIGEPSSEASIIKWDRLNSKAWVNGVEIENIQRAEVTTHLNAGVFKRAATEDSFGLGFFTGRINWIKEYDDEGNLLFNLVACEKDGKIGMFDSVANKFYFNTGTGNFVGGKQIGWIQDDGTIINYVKRS